MNKLVILTMAFVLMLCLATSLYEEGMESYAEGVGSGALLFIVLLALAFFFGPIAAMYLFFKLLSKVIRR